MVWMQDGYTVLNVRKNATKLVPPAALARLGLQQPTPYRGDSRYLAMASGGDPQRLAVWDTARNDTLVLGENDVNIIKLQKRISPLERKDH